jgi:hypothetical protein
MFVRRVDRPLDREGQALDFIALEREMRLSEARSEPRAEDLQLTLLTDKAELDAMPVEPRSALPFARRNRRASELADMPGHLGIIMMREHRDVSEHVVEAVGRFQIIELLACSDEIADRKYTLRQHREEHVVRNQPRHRNGPPTRTRL